MPFDPTTGSQYPNLLTLARRTDPNGKIAKIVELLNQTNPILDDAYYVEGNLPTGHMTTVRTDIPHGTWRKLNYGIRPTASMTTQVTDTCGTLENRSQVDVKLANINANKAEFLLSEARPIIEGINQGFASTIFYGNIANHPERFNGVAMRYDKLGTPTGKPTANNYMNQVINGGASSGNTTSIWLIGWGENTVHMFYPKGSTQGIEQKDLGEIDAFDADGGIFRAYATIWGITGGLVVRDWRYIVRIANIDIAAVTGDATKMKTLVQQMITAINTIPQLSMCRPAFYMNRAVKNIFDIAAQEKGNLALSIGEVWGKPQTNFWGIPLKQCDAILATESVLTT